MKFYIFGYAEYMKNAIEDILVREDVCYFDLFEGKNLFEKSMHRVFVSRHIRLFSKLIMPFWANRYLNGQTIMQGELPVFIMYEINPLSNKVQWIKKMKKSYPELKIVYIFTNIITGHNMWRLDQIQKHPELYDIIITFNRTDAEKYGMLHIEGIFSPKIPSKEAFDKAEESDIYFCGLDKGRLNDLISVYTRLSQEGINCNFHVIYAKPENRLYKDRIHYHDTLIDNQEMLAGVLKSKCVLELMVDRTQPGSSLRMCEAVAYRRKLLTNNSFAAEKPFFNADQMQIFNVPEEINVDFIREAGDKSKYVDPSRLSPHRLLKMVEETIQNAYSKTD